MQCNRPHASAGRSELLLPPVPRGARSAGMGIPSCLEASCVRKTPEDPPKIDHPPVIRQGEGIRQGSQVNQKGRSVEAAKRICVASTDPLSSGRIPPSSSSPSPPPLPPLDFQSQSIPLVNPDPSRYSPIVTSLVEWTSIMADASEQRAVATAFAPPPPMWKHFTRDNLDKLDQVKKEASKDTDGAYTDEKKWSPAELRALDLPPELRFLVPPEIPTGEYTVFGEPQTVCSSFQMMCSGT